MSDKTKKTQPVVPTALEFDSAVSAMAVLMDSKAVSQYRREWRATMILQGLLAAGGGCYPDQALGMRLIDQAVQLSDSLEAALES